jgi:hypothetical protein
MSRGWHDLTTVDVDEKLDDLNRFLKDRGFRSKFRLVTDRYGWDIVFDDGGTPEIVDTEEHAERIVEELCG